MTYLDSLGSLSYQSAIHLYGLKLTIQEIQVIEGCSSGHIGFMQIRAFQVVLFCPILFWMLRMIHLTRFSKQKPSVAIFLG